MAETPPILHSVQEMLYGCVSGVETPWGCCTCLASVEHDSFHSYLLICSFTQSPVLKASVSSSILPHSLPKAKASPELCPDYTTVLVVFGQDLVSVSHGSSVPNGSPCLPVMPGNWPSVQVGGLPLCSSAKAKFFNKASCQPAMLAPSPGVLCGRLHSFLCQSIFHSQSQGTFFSGAFAELGSCTVPLSLTHISSGAGLLKPHLCIPDSLHQMLGVHRNLLAAAPAGRLRLLSRASLGDNSPR